MPAVAREHTISGWTELETELDAWQASGSQATFWWRDDDATKPGPRLERLLDLVGTRPVSLAVIPAQATPALTERLRSASNVSVLQHGYAHQNHAPAEEKKAEFGDHRPFKTIRSELTTGRARLEKLFGDRFMPVFVPPWNRFGDVLLDELKAQHFTGLSTFGPRGQDSKIKLLNCHADIIDWRGGRGFLGTENILGRLVDHLVKRRLGIVDSAEPTGLLTHHRDHDLECWKFIEDLPVVINNHPAAAWQSSAEGIASAPQ
jgi:hypothetical protein